MFERGSRNGVSEGEEDFTFVVPPTLEDAVKEANDDFLNASMKKLDLERELDSLWGKYHDFTKVDEVFRKDILPKLNKVEGEAQKVIEQYRIIIDEMRKKESRKK